MRIGQIASNEISNSRKIPKFANFRSQIFLFQIIFFLEIC